jgi:hypothetical protein
MANKISNSVSRDNYKKHWKHAKEWTSSSILGLHFRHWKAATNDDYLLEVHAHFTEIVVSTGFSPELWQQGITVTLGKEPGIHLPDKLCTILLMEADFNFPNKLFLGRCMIEKKAEEYNEIPDEIYARKGHQVIEVGINQVLTFNIFRQKWTPGSDTSLDAGQYYDQLAHNMLLIVCQHHGMAIEAILSLFLTIQMMQFFLHTAFGNSTIFYTGINGSIPFQGIYQGNGGSPSLFLCISIVLVKALHTNGHIAVFVVAISSVQTQFSSMLHVDDASLINHALHPDEPVSQVIL